MVDHASYLELQQQNTVRCDFKFLTASRLIYGCSVVILNLDWFVIQLKLSLSETTVLEYRLLFN